MGIYFLEQGAMQRSSQVIYDRKDSAFSKFTGVGLDWDQLLNGVDCVHWSGISPALSQEVADLTLALLEQANARKILVCGDLNYRSNLWNYGKAPHEVMPKLMELTQVMIAGTRDFKQCLNQDFGSFLEVKRKVFDRFPKLDYLVKTDRESYSSSANSLTAGLHTRKKAFSSRTYELTHIVDRVGSGDAFAAGLIYGLLHLKPKEAIEFAMAAGALKHSVPGDVLTCTLQEVQELVAGEGNGKIKR
jgi:2-dehydro-3-deoxygluconokinase